MIALLPGPQRTLANVNYGVLALMRALGKELSVAQPRLLPSQDHGFVGRFSLATKPADYVPQVDWTFLRYEKRN
jgi:hypothetical protein